MQLRFQASTGTEVVTYQGYGRNEAKTEMRADSEPVTIDITDALKNKNFTLFHPFTTTLVEVVLNRVPYPFDKAEGIFVWLPPLKKPTEDGGFGLSGG
jgi:hypothetical protein